MLHCNIDFFTHKTRIVLRSRELANHLILLSITDIIVDALLENTHYGKDLRDIISGDRRVCKVYNRWYCFVKSCLQRKNKNKF